MATNRNIGRECINKFVRFMNGVLESRKWLHLDTFEYYCSFANCRNHYLEWLSRVAALMPRVIIFNIIIFECMDIPDSVFSCASLQNLKLHINSYHIIVIRPESINLPSLKVLELISVELNDDFTRKLFSGCPALESLVLRFCTLGFSDITSNTLKMLNIVYCHKTKKMQISCSGLVSLDVSFGGIKPVISVKNMTSLSTANIKLYAHCADLSILSSLSNATTIKICGNLPSMEQLKKDIPSCRTFNNLKILELGGWDMTTNFDLVACFLENSPNLQRLYLWLLGEWGRRHIQVQPRQAVMRDVLCMLEYVEFVKISGGNKDESNKLVNMLRRYIKNIGHLTYPLSWWSAPMFVKLLYYHLTMSVGYVVLDGDL